MRKLDATKRAAIIAAMVEGMSVNSITRICGVSKLTVLRLLNDIGALCLDFHDLTVRGVAPKRIQCDEIWSFCHAKEKNVPEEKRGVFGYGDVWTWVAIDPDSKLVVSWHVGLRTVKDAEIFMFDLAERVTTIVDLTTDGFGAYPPAVQAAFGGFVSYAQVVKHYGRDPNDPDTRYSPAKCTGITVTCINGNPENPSTSHVERQNLTIRMGNRRFTRLTNAFSKKAANHAYALALFYFHYNFCRKHMSLDGKTPAQAAGLTTERLTIGDLVAMLETEENRRGNGGRINRENRS